VKEFLSRKGIDFTERDISRDAAAIDDLRRMRIMATPVTVINGTPVTGFDEARLNQLLGETAKAA
jgi:glutaredoxin 3